jgi:hypothetical protein
MNLFQKVCVSACIVMVPVLASAQEFYQHDTTVKVTAYGNPMPLAWCGGFNNPQISQADLNRDGLPDLVLFETGLGVTTLLNTGMLGGMPRYKFAPKYALNFPPAYSYMLLKDYNCDGIADLFDRGTDGFSVYKGYYNAGNELCFSFYTNLFYHNDAFAGGAANAYVNPGDIPAIEDVDGDGDLDFVSYYITGGYMYYYRNMRIEDGLPCDSIRIKLKDRCWGKVYQGFNREHQLGYSCSNAGLSRPASKVTHSGNSVCLFDWDMDGDIDYLDGNVSFSEMTFLKNGKVENAYAVDTMVLQDTLWQTGGKKVVLPTWPAAFNIDANNDGKKDLLIAPNAGSSSENYKNIWYYRNNSSAGAPDWQFQSDSFLVDKSIDLGTASYPLLFDYDKDGKLDLLVGSDGYRQSSGLLRSRMSLYKNTSTPGNGSFALQSTDFINMSIHNFEGAAPATGDIDNDAKSDLIVGHTNGTLSYFKNMAASESVQPDWQLNQLELKDQTGAVINVDGNAAPFIYDIDKDGKKDLIIGNVYGFIQYYQNVSTSTGVINLKLVNLKLGEAKSDPLQNFGNYATPFIGKIDPSGTDYLLMGSNSGNVYRYTGFQTGDTTATYSMLDGQYSYIDTTFNIYNHPATFFGIYGNRRSSVTVGDIDGSGSYSLIKGNVRGGLEFYKRKIYVANTPDVSKECKVIIYPNPAGSYLSVSWTGIPEGEVELKIIDMAGRQCTSTTLPAIPGQTTLSVGNLAAGVYICMLQNGVCRYYSKFSVVR